MGSYRFDGDPRSLLAAYDELLDTIGEDASPVQLCVVDDTGITIYDTCPSAEVFEAFSTSDDLHAVLSSVGLPTPAVTPLGEVHLALAAGSRVGSA